MKPLRDPEGAELHHLIKACQPAGKDILEIGCGDGTFTVQYAGMVRKVIGIDPEFFDLNEASHKPRLSDSFFIQANGEQLPFPSQAFDIVIFASSL
jgi:ubiquinone/menaquinone biosynthesis C-methylase UbiE